MAAISSKSRPKVRHLIAKDLTDLLSLLKRHKVRNVWIQSRVVDTTNSQTLAYVRSLFWDKGILFHIFWHASLRFSELMSIRDLLFSLQYNVIDGRWEDSRVKRLSIFGNRRPR